MTEDEYQMKRYNKMFLKFVNGFYNNIYFDSKNILVFERPNGNKNCLNIEGLDIHIDELDRYRNLLYIDNVYEF
tara:strand:- start:87 stop:308 length:222 start_codon:yes stop_codon:yes gene_type:complete